MVKKHKFTLDVVKWKNSWTMDSRFGLLAIFTVLFLYFLLVACTSSSFQHLQKDGFKEKLQWSAEEDLNYEGGLGKLLKTTRGAEDSEEASSEEEDELDEKPSYMFSIHDLRELLKNEIKLYRGVKTYLLRVENRMDKMKRWVKDFEESTVKAALQLQVVKDTDAEPLDKLVTNPFVRHRTVRRFSKDLHRIVDLFNLQAEQRFLKEAVQTSSSELHIHYHPTVEEDYVDSMDALLRIQHYNNYTTRDMQKGKLGHKETHITLDSVHAFDLAVHSYFHLRPETIRTLGIEWMEMALNLFEEEGIVDDKFKDNMTATLELMVKSHDESWEEYRFKESEWVFDDKIGADFGSHLPQRPRYRRDFEAMRHRSEEEYSEHTTINFRTLCSGRNLQTEAEKAKLTCWYDHTTHPYWTINPIKKEALSLNPELYQMYDILSPGAIKYIIDRAAPEMTRSLVIDPNDPKKSYTSNVRTSSQTWFYEHQPMLTEISKRIEYSSGLNVLKEWSSEALQVASYGGSHHYDEHLDVLQDPRRTAEKGERIATYMLYLTNVEVGGKTAFPVMGTVATPVAGSAVMWYNVKRNGEPDYRTGHGGCPVVYGEKWVANKWILSFENWNKRPCSLNPEE